MMPARQEPNDLLGRGRRFGSLKFAPLTEDLFKDYAFDQNKKWFLTGTFVVTLLFTAFFAAMYLMRLEGMLPLAVIAPIWVLTIAALIAGRKLAERADSAHARGLSAMMAVICVGIAAEISYFTAFAAPELARYTYGLLLVYTISIYALVQLRGVAAAAAGWGAFAVYVWVAYREHSYVLHDNFLQICSYFVVTNLLGSGISYMIERQDRVFFLTLLNSAEAAYKTDRLLRTVLPEAIAERMKLRQTRIADQYELVTVMFAQVSGIAPLADTWEPRALVAMLNRLFGAFDRVVDAHGVDKIKTSGSRFLAVAGLRGGEGHGERVAQAALRLAAEFARLRGELGVDLQLSIGVHAGPLVAGVIGTKKFMYDVWGDTVNVASRMASLSGPGEIRLSNRAAALVAGEPGLVLGPPQVVDVKGKGKMSSHLLSASPAADLPAPPRLLPVAG